MAEFVSSFITGFQDVIAADIVKRIPGCKILNLFDGLIHYRYDGDSRNLNKISYFNNTFFVLKILKGNNLNFPALVGSVCSEKKYFLINKGSIRVRFCKENQFAKVDKNLSKKVEDFIIRNSKLKIDRLSPSTELWFSIRRENFAFAGQLINKREFTEKNLNKGELRPEIAYLLCSYAEIKSNEFAADPFSGYGSIPVQASKHFKCSKFYSSDIDEEKIKLIESRLAGKENIIIKKCNAFDLGFIENKTLDVIITDPPWGYFEDIGDVTEFYLNMFDSFRKVLKDSGRMVVLSARTENLEIACEKSGVKIISKFSTLVNGKKASVYKLTFI